jgi:hypothetical protein
MRVLKKSINKNLPRSRLFLADLRSIYDILKKHYENVIIQTSDYEISDFDQLKKIGSSEIHNMTFDCYVANSWSSKIRIYFRKNFATIQMDEDTTLNRGILTEIEAVIDKRKQRITSILTNTNFLLCFSLILIGTLFWLMSIDAAILVLCLAFLLFTNFAYFYWLQENNYSVIALYERRERPSFLKRNKDRIIVAIISSVITAFLTYIATMLANRNGS